MQAGNVLVQWTYTMCALVIWLAQWQQGLHTWLLIPTNKQCSCCHSCLQHRNVPCYVINPTACCLVTLFLWSAVCQLIQLIPKFGVKASDMMIMGDNCLYVGHEFYINSFADKETFHAILYSVISDTFTTPKSLSHILLPLCHYLPCWYD